jgi:hypothetical protein
LLNDGGAIAVVGNTAPAHGTLTMNNDGAFRSVFKRGQSCICDS